MTAPACPAHADLVARATGTDPSDEDLERYAHEVPDCPSCRRALVVALQVHPTVLAQGGHRPAQAAWTASTARRQVGTRTLHAAIHTPAPTRRGLILAVGLPAAALVLSLLSWPAWQATHPTPEPPPAEAATRTVVDVGPTRNVPLAELPVPTPMAMAPRQEQRVEVQRIVQVSSPAPSEFDGAVAMLDNAPDWPAPPLEDLRTGQAKSAGGDLDVALLLSGASPMAVRDAVSLTVVTERATPLAVCVAGPETGVIWRGWVNAGRTELSRDGRLQSFAFARPGAYAFTMSVEDLEHCGDAYGTVTVEVRP